MIRTILWFIYFWIQLLLLLPKMKRAERLFYSQEDQESKQEELQELVGQVVPHWAKSLLQAAGVKVEVRGLENMPSDPALYVSNHQGNFDIPLLLAYLGKPKGIVAKISLLKMPFINRWMHYFGCVFIDRDDARQSLKVLSEAENRLREGHSMIIFPEGTRSKSHHIGEFKSAALKLAYKSGVPVVPVAIDGTYRIMEQQKYFIKPGMVRLTVLPPMETANLNKEEQKLLADQVRALIEQCLVEDASSSN